MRFLSVIVASLLVVATPLAARAQGAIGVGVRILEREEVRMADASSASLGAEQLRVERTRRGETRLSVPLVLTHRIRPVLSIQQRAGDPACELVAADAARTDAGWGTTLRCTASATAAAGAPAWARLVIVPNT